MDDFLIFMKADENKTTTAGSCHSLINYWFSADGTRPTIRDSADVCCTQEKETGNFDDLIH